MDEAITALSGSAFQSLIVLGKNSTMYFKFQALKLLSEHIPNRAVMQNEMGMVISLKKIMNTEGYHYRAKQLAKEVHNSIVPPPKRTRTPSRHRYTHYDIPGCSKIM